MSDFTDNVRKAFELYLFGQKKEALSHLMPGTKYHSYISIIDAMKREKSKLTKDTKDLIQSFLETNYGDEAERVRMRKLFLDYDAATNDAGRKTALDTIGSQLSAYFHHTKPMDLARKTHKKEEKKTSVKSDGKGIDNIFNVKNFIAKAESKDSYQLQYVHHSLYNDIDYSKVNDDEFLAFVRNATYLADITTPSFIKKWSSAIIQKYKDNSYYNMEYYLFDKLTIDQMEQIEAK